MNDAKCVYHVWFSTKERRPILDSEIGNDVRAFFMEIAKRASIGLLELGLALDHVHALVEISSDQSLTSVMHQLKGASAHAVFRSIPI